MVCLIYAKPPRPGLSKTRLAASVGPEAAARLAEAFLVDTARALGSLQGLGSPQGLEIVLSTPEPEIDHGVALPRWDQGGGELGCRLERGFLRALGQSPAAMALGADSPGLPAGHLQRAIALLSESPRQAARSVLCPTEDGGFWALGLTRCWEGLLQGLPWSTPQTAEATRQRLLTHGFEVSTGPGWWDVDTASDLERLRREVAPDAAPESHRVLSTLSWNLSEEPCSRSR